MHVTHAPPLYAELFGFVQMLSLSPSAQPLIVFFPKGCVRTLLAPMQALSIVSMPPKPFRCMPRFPLITRVSYTTTVCVLLPPDNQQSPCSATPFWKQKFDIGCTIYRRVVIPHPAVLEDKKSASKAPFCLIF